MTEPAPRPLPPGIRAILEQRSALRDVNTEVATELSALDRIVMWVTEHVGTMGFFLAILAWTVLWLGWNLLAPAPLRFDPPTGFVFWLFISNMIQILLMPLIMIGQNLQSRHAELRAERDLEVNIQAEREIKAILEHLEYQNALLLELVGQRTALAAARLGTARRRNIVPVTLFAFCSCGPRALLLSLRPDQWNARRQQTWRAW